MNKARYKSATYLALYKRLQELKTLETFSTAALEELQIRKLTYAHTTNQELIA